MVIFSDLCCECLKLDQDLTEASQHKCSVFLFWNAGKNEAADC